MECYPEEIVQENRRLRGAIEKAVEELRVPFLHDVEIALVVDKLERALALEGREPA